MIRRALAVAAALTGAAGCRPAAPPRIAAVIRTPVALPAPLPTLAAPAAPGDLVGAVEKVDALYLFARDRVVIDRGGATVATAAAPAGGWAEAVAIPALDRSETGGRDPDGSAGGAVGRASRGIDDAETWVVARTVSGELWRITATGDLEPVHDRLGLPPGARAIAASSATLAIALDDGIAILRDQRHLARFPADPPRASASPASPTSLTSGALGALGASGALAAGANRIAIRRGDAVEVWDLLAQRRADYAVPGAIAAAFVAGDHGDRLVVATPGALYVADGGRLHRIATPTEIRGLAAAGSRLWLATARGVELLQADALVPTAVPTTAADRLFGLAGGDLLIAARGSVTRLSIASTEDDPRWQAAVQPIVQRVCSRCHHPGGSGRGDLSTVAAWRAERAELIRRIVNTRTMPPAGTELDDTDRRVLAGWLLDGHAAP